MIRASILYTGPQGIDVPLADTTDPNTIQTVAEAALQQHRRLCECLKDPLLAAAHRGEIKRLRTVLRAAGIHTEEN